MTTKPVVADGKSEVEVRGLVQVKANELVERLIRESLKTEVVLDGMQLLIEGLDIKGEMIFTPLEWSEDLDEQSEVSGSWALATYIRCNGPGWRLPTAKELARAMRSTKPGGFLISRSYWTSTPWTGAEGGMEVIMSYGFDDALNGGSSNNDYFKLGQNSPRFRLCREKKLD